MRYCAFLRGVNINASSMKMVDVCKVFTDEGMFDVCSVQATGNILFTSTKKTSDVKKILENAMSKHFNYDAFLFLKNKAELTTMVEKNPYQKSDTHHIYLFIGTDSIEKKLMEEFNNTTKLFNESAEIVEGNFYWQIQKGNTLESSFGKILGKKSFKDKMTSRNINTIEKILKKI